MFWVGLVVMLMVMFSGGWVLKVERFWLMVLWSCLVNVWVLVRLCLGSSMKNLLLLR